MSQGLKDGLLDIQAELSIWAGGRLMAPGCQGWVARHTSRAVNMGRGEADGARVSRMGC